MKKKMREGKNSFIRKLIVLLSVIFIILVVAYGILLIKGDRSGENKENLNGNLGTIGVFSVEPPETNPFLPEGCNEGNITEIWNYMFRESVGGLTIIYNESEGDCIFLAYNLSENYFSYLMVGEYRNEKDYASSAADVFYGNFTPDLKEYLGQLNSSNIVEIEGELLSMIFFIDRNQTLFVQENRSIINESEADAEFIQRFNLQTGIWDNRLINGQGAYTFAGLYDQSQKYNFGEVFQNISLDLAGHTETYTWPLNLTQTRNIGDVHISGTDEFESVDLGNFFENLGEPHLYPSDWEFINLSYSISDPQFSDVVEVYPNDVFFDAGDHVGGNFTMNITLSHPTWNNGENVTTNNFNVNISRCLDTTGSTYSTLFRNQTFRNTTTNLTDYCVNSSQVMNYYCLDSVILNESESCPMDYNCTNGECVWKGSPPPNITYHPPVYDTDCNYFNVEMNDAIIVNMRDCFNDSAGDIQNYWYENSSMGNLSVSRSGTKLTLTPKQDYLGNQYLYFYANDTYNQTKSDRIRITVFKPTTSSSSSSSSSSGSSPGANTSASQNSTMTMTGSTPGQDIYIFPRTNKTFSVTASNYDSVNWFLNGSLVKTGSLVYDTPNLVEGNYTVKVELKRGNQTISKNWNLVVAGDEQGSAPVFDTKKVILYVAIVIISIVLLLVIYLLATEASRKPQPAGMGVSLVKPPEYRS